MLETGALTAQTPQVYIPHGGGSRAQSEQNREFAKVFGEHIEGGELESTLRRQPKSEETADTSCAAPLVAATQITYAAPETAAPSNDTEVDSVVIPARSANQEDLLALVARLAGAEGDGDFLRSLEPTLQEILEPNELSRPVTMPRLEEIVSGLLPETGAGTAAPAAPEELPFLVPAAQTGNNAKVSPGAEIFDLQELPLEISAEDLEITVIPSARRSAEPVFTTPVDRAPQLADTVKAPGIADAVSPPEFSAGTAAVTAPAEAAQTDEQPVILPAGTAESAEPGSAGPVKASPKIAEAAPVKEDKTPSPRTDADFAPRQPTAPKAAATPMPQETPVRRAVAADILDQVVKAAELRSAQAGTSIELELAPKFLGKLNISLVATQDGITARIKAGNDAVREMLSQNLPALQQTLKDAGINMKNIEIARHDISWDFSRGSLSQQRQGFDRERASQEGSKILSLGRAVRSAAQERMTVAVSGTIYAAGAVAPDVWSDTSFDYRA